MHAMAVEHGMVSDVPKYRISLDCDRLVVGDSAWGRARIILKLVKGLTVALTIYDPHQNLSTIRRRYCYKMLRSRLYACPSSSL